MDERADMYAKDAEHSSVSVDTRTRVEGIIREAIAENVLARSADIARRVVADLSDAELAEIVGDWLEDRGRGL